MSYILEALKKSESERQQASSPPSIYSPKPPPPIGPEKQPKKPRRLLWCVLSLLVIIVIAAGYHLYSSKIINITITVPEENRGSKTQNTTVKTDSDPVAEVEKVPKSPASLPVIQQAGKKTVTSEETSVEVEAKLQESIVEKTTPVETLGNNSSVPRLEELDQAFQNKVPELKLAGHVYSEDASLRMILINDRIVREKGAAAKDFILEEITPQGIILRNGVTRFRIDIP
jgi:general secretion pathway protein B